MKDARTSARSSHGARCVFPISDVNYQRSCATFSPTRSICFIPMCPTCLTDSSTGVGRRLLKRAVWRSVEGRSTGGQHVASAFLGDSLSRWLGGRLRGLLGLVFLRRGRVGSWPSLRDQLGSSRWLEAAVMLEETRGEALKWCLNDVRIIFLMFIFRIGLLLNCCVGVFFSLCYKNNKHHRSIIFCKNRI